MNDKLFLFATIAGTPVALRASEIEAVVRLGDIVPIQRVPPHVRGLAALRSRVLTVIDIESRIFGRPMPVSARPLAVVCEVAAHTYGLLVETVSDICEAPDGIHAIQGRIDRAWAPFASALVEREGRSHLLLRATDFVSTPVAAKAA
ncbi:MAG TPA: chemotaxis protein CheW [Sphingobium sp.]|nr:chemotaxis protein CheW [Sphingobium sp.]